MWFEDKWMQLEDIMISEVSQAQKTGVTCFLSYMEDKHIPPNKHDHMQTHMWNMLAIFEVFYGTLLGERRKGKENDRRLVIL
jgi:hypothetical protein